MLGSGWVGLGLEQLLVLVLLEGEPVAVEQLGLVDSPRSSAGYRLYGPAQLQRLRTLRVLLEQHGVELGDIGFALRLRREPDLAGALDAWFEAEPRRPAGDSDDEMPDGDWLAFEQDKHQQLLQP